MCADTTTYDSKTELRLYAFPAVDYILVECIKFKVNPVIEVVDEGYLGVGEEKRKVQIRRW